jgi:DHA1 family multidrug resistance protein-like MFS transporter
MNRDLILLAIALFTWGIGEGSFLYFQPIYLENLGASPIAIGTILGGVGIAMAIVHIPAGHLADRWGRRILLWVAWISGFLSALVMTVANSLPLFVTGMILYGLTAFVMSPLNSYITAARGELSVGRAITTISATYNAGAVLGPIIGGYIGNHFGLSKVYPFATGVFFISTLVVLNLRPQAITPRKTLSSQGSLINREFISYLVIIFLVIFALYLAQPLTPNFLQNQRRLSLSAIGQVGAAGSLGNVVLSLVFGRLNSFHGFLLSQISVSIFALILWQGSGLPLFMIGYFLLGGYRVAKSLAIALVRDLVDIASMGLAYGITETVSMSSVFLVSPLAGYLYDINPLIIYPITIIMIGLSLIISLYCLPRITIRRI